ncbi:MAG: IMP dehydrogenase [Acidocella sp. 20-57-95]|nr:MAG: IMP dehydrogenase [Acidocella sp. 20-57-95]HQT65184.1 transglutaminase family protein [Acidocella sp.]
MSIHAAITHRTSYKYDRPVTMGPQTIRLRPAPHARTPILSYSLKISPQPHFLNWQQDPQGNYLARVVFPERVTSFEVVVDVVADMATINPFDFFLEPEAENYPFKYDDVLAEELAPFRVLRKPGKKLTCLINAVNTALGGKELRMVDMLVMVNRLIAERISYVVRMEPGVWSPEKTLTEGKGSCRDSAWLLVNLLRHLGFAARFVSGYLIQLVADQKPIGDGPAGPTEDFTDLHAWAEVYLPGAGWIGLDATSGLMAGEGHIPLAATPSPMSAAAISGLVGECKAEFDFDMKVTRVAETPRVTKPYTPRQWQDILARGAAVDLALAKGDVRLTMGGEPTFVSATDMEAPEWNIDAMGPTKRQYAGRLIRKLTPLWAKGAALTYNMGKHYPGEQLPRWAIHAHWRQDGEPVWRDPALLASDDDHDTAKAEDAAKFAEALAERLQIDPSLVNPAYEDIHYYLWREHRLPANVVAEDAKLRDELERKRLAKVYSQGLAAPVGSVLPLRRVIQDGSRRWQSGKWFFRDSVMFLVPGDSPIGLRLPLEGLPWAEPDHIEGDFEADPFAPREALPKNFEFKRLRTAAPGSGIEGFRPVPQDAPIVGKEEPGVVRTALAVEARDGILHVFYPPLYNVEDWLELTAAIEDTAEEFGRKVILEGYLPPEDERVLNFSVTPDPGVIETNIHPANSWAEIVERTTQLYDVAREIGLATEKFMLDGRHVGTGGGNHVVMGGASPADSPFLRRPDLLKSMLGFWHNHPSLSFLFSGLFIGPSSQHPRIDEARQDSLNELEIAFQQVSRQSNTPPWMVDRLFRNILADMTGNTHRTEFCIDKMYDPNSSSGRRGLVEFRAFEMPPHAEMSAAQVLLMRSAIAAFWEKPYERRMIRWGTRLHDEFLLPHYAEADFKDALAELEAFGFPLNPEWFAPHLEFRFPQIGEIAVNDMKVELRHALEPWHVLGEEQVSGGTARYVDSSAERVQTKVSGWVDERYILSCNGAALPLQKTEVAGEYVAGVRFKAWQPYSAMHPTIGAQVPLVFDVYDTWSGRSVGGMTHHVAHPGGRAYDDFPVNANSAEARRRSRFFPMGHTPGPMQAPKPVPGPEYPRTLDLRRYA